MSLITDSIFVSAIGSSPELMTMIGSRLYGTAIPLPDEDADNVAVPYVIVTYDGMTNEGQSKDWQYEGDSDQVNIGVLAVATTLSDLHALTSLLRQTIRGYFEDHEGEAGFEQVPEDYQISASGIAYDPIKPCYYQTLNYQCDTVRE